MNEITFGIKDVIYIIGLVGSVGTIYWSLVIRIVKLEAKETEVTKKIDSLIETVTILSKQIGEHIAYHKGKVDAHKV
jgi:hypothetical protein